MELSAERGLTSKARRGVPPGPPANIVPEEGFFVLFGKA